MKKIILLVLALFAISAFAIEPVQPVEQPTVKSISKVLSKKSKRHLKALYQAQFKNFAEDNDDYGPPDAEDLDIHRAYDRPRLIVITQDNFGVSAEMAARLKLARQLAVQRHQEIWCGG